MQIGDLVKNLHSESRMTGIIVDWHEYHGVHHPLVVWADGRGSWITSFRIEVVHLT